MSPNMPLNIGEAEYQRAVVERAYLRGWYVAHFRPAMNKRGHYSSAMEGHVGFPDLVLARDGVVIFRAVKTQHGRLSPMQNNWLTHLGADAGIWRPSDFTTVAEELA